MRKSNLIKSYKFRHLIISALQDIDIRGIRKISYLLPKVLLPKPKGALVIRTLYGFYMNIDPEKDHGVEESIYRTGTYEKGTLFIMRNILKEGDVFVDVGANIGLMSIFASLIVKETGKTIAFEPNPETMKILESNIELNHISNIETSNYAVGEKREQSRVYEHWESNRGSASLIKPDIETTSYDVNVIALSDYFRKDQTIHVIKIDIEGYELLALKGARSILAGKSPPMLIVECSETRENAFGEGLDKLYDYLKKINQYRLFKPTADKSKVSKLIEIADRTELPQHDNIYCFTNRHMEQIPDKVFKINKAEP